MIYGKACRVCLVMDVKMFSMEISPLKTYYGEITGYQVSKDDEFPKYFCYECAALISKYHIFRTKCLRSLSILENILTSENQITENSIRNINRCSENLDTCIKKCSDKFRTASYNYKEIESAENFGTDIDLSEDLPLSSIKRENSETIEYYSENVDETSNTLEGFPEGSTFRNHLILHDDIAENSIKKINKCIKKCSDKSRNSCNYELSEAENFHSDEDLEDLPLSSIRKENSETIGNGDFDSLDDNLEKSKKYRKLKKKRKKRLKGGEAYETESGKEKRRRAIILEKSQWKVINLTDEEQIKEFGKRAEVNSYKRSLFKCEKCFRGFPEESTFQNHLVLHSDSRGKYECSLCKLRYVMPSRLRSHLKKHQLRYSCTVCTFVTNTTNTAEKHTKFHEGHTYQCHHCSVKFRQWTSYLTHLRTRHRSDFVCSCCGASFVNERGLRAHTNKAHRLEANINKETTEKIYCSDCDMQFRNVSAHQKHLLTSARHKKSQDVDSTRNTIRRDRQPRQPVTCEKCNEVFPTDQQCMRHYKTEHPGEKYIQRYVCEVCGSTKSNYWSLVLHQRVHTGERPFKCPECDMTFKNGSNRDRHMLKHTGEKRYACDKCDKRYTLQGSLSCHIRTAHLNMPYPKRKRRKPTRTINGEF